ncbi:unnamed protein product [Ixodes persulcatus]
MMTLRLHLSPQCHVTSCCNAVSRAVIEFLRYVNHKQCLFYCSESSGNFSSTLSNTLKKKILSIRGIFVYNSLQCLKMRETEIKDYGLVDIPQTKMNRSDNNL